MFSKIKRAVLVFLCVALALAIFTKDWDMLSDALGILAFLGFLAFVRAFFAGGQTVPSGSCGRCRGSGRVVMPGNFLNGTPCSH